MPHDIPRGTPIRVVHAYQGQESPLDGCYGWYVGNDGVSAYPHDFYVATLPKGYLPDEAYQECAHLVTPVTEDEIDAAIFLAALEGRPHFTRNDYEDL